MKLVYPSFSREFSRVKGLPERNPDGNQSPEQAIWQHLIAYVKYLLRKSRPLANFIRLLACENQKLSY
jgi:hypothetical protein